MEQQGRICPRGASYYIWQEGDTLQSVAQKNKTTAQAIQLINEGLDFNTIAAGYEICMPSQSYTCMSGQTYTVQVGDSLSSIAERYGITVLELMERNPGISSGLLAGQTICVPESTVPSAPQQPSQPSRPQQPTVPSQPSRPQQPVIPLCRSGYTAGTIQRGQTYADLLIRHNVSYQAMRSANPTLSPGYLTTGRTYCAPPAGTRQVCTSATRTYTIRSGENLTTLASALGTTRGRLLMLNPTLLPSDFAEGSTICIP